MGNAEYGPAPEFESTAENGFNPFKIKEITLKSPKDFNTSVALLGNPPMHEYTRQSFCALPDQKMAAYADGVVRGSYQEGWLIGQYHTIDPNSLDKMNYTGLGAIAYFYLKTGDVKYGNMLDIFRDRYKNDTRAWL